MFKIIAIALLTVLFLFELFVNVFRNKSRSRPIPEPLNDVYDSGQYIKWKNYYAENIIVDIIFSSISYAVVLSILISDVFAFITKGIDNIYVSAIVVISIYLGITSFVSFIDNVVTNKKIEQKYGFNKATMGTIIADAIKSLIISYALSIGLLCLFIVLYENMGDYILVLFSAIVVLLLLAFIFLYPLFSKIFNKFTPLPEGELRTKLINLLNKYGYKVKNINVMNASKRTSKSNAYFSGFGKSKVIVLFDNLLETVDEDEIVAIFAHEMGHGLHKDTLKTSITSFVSIVVFVVLAWLLAKFPEIYKDFGFEGLNYGFGTILLVNCVIPFAALIFSFIRSYFARRAEYKADEQAVKEGYGEQLISGLKKMYRKDFGDLNPHPFVVLLSYSHPTLLQRIEHIREYEKTFNQ